MIVLLLLGVIWAAVLIPPWMQARRDARPTASIRSFHRQLTVLERTSPGRRAMRHRVAGRVVRAAPTVAVYGGDDSFTSGYADSDGDVADGYGDTYADAYADDVGLGTGAGPAGAVSGTGAAGGYDPNAYGDAGGDRSYDGDPGDGDDSFGGPGMPAAAGWRGRGTAATRPVPRPVSALGEAWAGGPLVHRPRTVEPTAGLVVGSVPGYQRRRRVVAVLLLGVAATLPPALLIGGTGWWIGQLVADVLLVGYLALLVRRRRRSVERDEKVRYLAPIRAPEPAVVVLHGDAAR